MTSLRADEGVRGTDRLAPLVAPAPGLSDAEVARYARHLALPGLGVQGQRRLAAARVLVVGAGGLGSPALLYLAAAGVGTLGIVDDDVVDVTNLQRQVAHGESDVGRAKVASARATVAEVNPHVTVVEHPVRLTPDNVLDVLRGYDVVLDGADNFPTRYLVSDAAEVLGLPVVWGSIDRFDGQVAVFWGAPRHLVTGDDGAPRVETRRGVTYRDVFPVPPPPGTVPDCATGGVLGAMCGTIGSAMAVEAVKLVTGVGRTLHGRLAVHDALGPEWRELTVLPDPTREPVTALLPGDDAYAAFCGLAPTSASAPSTDATTAATTAPTAGPAGDPQVSGAEAAALLAADPPAVLVDVREEWEAQVRPLAGARLVPSGTFLGRVGGAGEPGPDAAARAALADLPTDRPVVLVCAVGARSARVAAVAREAGIDARSVVGGLPALG
ncbi:adenylyltransferase/sulfurtransferase [Isoptericola jiangsuensis]|uniref:Adenylyltransferase/sulfurtransferase n=1 Tax=Isoptericola jiangsuensis TaxID=548579 RepID=A0A2A9EVM0_9MICO|nr:ThiF family adenylyltransferase [Isoptericola jiangsuensis]PFG42285.1 adenylyltransferase/sulfurtransferase [Isoptericola jiangsuensis]